MARLKIAYIGGGSTRAAGTMASFIEQGANFAGSEIVLIDLDAERLELIRGLAERMAAAKGVDLTVSATTDRRAGLDGCDAILTSYRPGGFEARVLDERIPLAHGVIGQETQGPGGFFMALRSIHVMREILDDVAVACPGARIFNYTNPVNIVAQAVTDHSDVPFVSLCEGPIVYPEETPEAAGSTRRGSTCRASGSTTPPGACGTATTARTWLPLLAGGLRAARARPELGRRRADAAAGGGDGRAAERVLPVLLLRGRGPARAAGQADDARRGHPRLGARLLGPLRRAGAQRRAGARSGRSRGGIHELELAIDCMDAVYNDRGETLPVNVPNQGSVPGFPDTLVVETLGHCDADGVRPLPMPGLPTHLRGLVEALAEYQQAAADAAWSGDARDGVRALAAHPLVRSIDLAERLYAELAAAHRDYLPARLLPDAWGDELRPPLALLEGEWRRPRRRGHRGPASARHGSGTGHDPAPPCGREHLVGPVEVLERREQRVAVGGGDLKLVLLAGRRRHQACSMTHRSGAPRGVNRVLRTIEPWISIGNGGTDALALERDLAHHRVARSSHSWRLRSSWRSNGCRRAAMIGAIHSGTSISRSAVGERVGARGSGRRKGRSGRRL